MTGMNKDFSKRYWLFTMMTYYPCGGMDDFENSFDSIEEAASSDEAKDSLWCGNFYVWDSITCCKVMECYGEN